jgi:hypothetical protein
MIDKSSRLTAPTKECTFPVVIAKGHACREHIGKWM